MKKFITIPIILICTSVFSQIIWEKPISIAPNNYGNVRPIIKLINDSIPSVIWSNSSTKDSYFSKYFNGTFTSPTKLNPNGMDVMTYEWSGPEMDISNENIFVVFRNNPWDNGHVYLIKSNDSGDTWSDTIRVDSFNINEKLAYYPSITASNDTNLTIVFMHHPGNDVNPQYVRITSNDGGNTFSDTLDLSRKFGAEACDCCPPNIISKNERQIFIYRNNDQNIREFRCLTSNDFGQTFNDSIGIDNGNWSVPLCPSSLASSVIVNDTLFTAYMSDAKVYINFSIINDGTQEYRGVVSSLAGSKNYPKIASNGKKNVVVWEGTGNSTDLYINTFDVGFNNFFASESKVLIDSSNAQVKPDIAIFDTNIYVVYTDKYDGTVKFLKGRFGELPPIDTNNLHKQIPELNIYPNPSNDYVHIQTRFDVAFVSDYTGKILFTTDKNPIDLITIPTGKYFISIIEGDKKQVYRFIKN